MPMSSYFDLSDVDRFVPGTIGVPGARTFYVQIGAGGQVISLKCEKLQVGALAEALRNVLVDLQPVSAVELPRAMELQGPLVAEFTVGSIGLGYEPDSDRILVMFEEAVPEEQASDGGAGQVRVALTRAQALGFAGRGDELLAGGRPGCVLCGSPIDAVIGYSCACFN
jgi:uncharacterized repeat protein (TIGR03847 family)